MHAGRGCTGDGANGENFGCGTSAILPEARTSAPRACALTGAQRAGDLWEQLGVRTYYSTRSSRTVQASWKWTVHGGCAIRGGGRFMASTGETASSRRRTPLSHPHEHQVDKASEDGAERRRFSSAPQKNTRRTSQVALREDSASDLTHLLAPWASYVQTLHHGAGADSS